MKYKITLCENWRPGTMLYTPGTYRVPEDISEEMAAEAMKAVRVVKLSTKAPAPENKLLAVPENKGLKKTGAVKPSSSQPLGPRKSKKT